MWRSIAIGEMAANLPAFPLTSFYGAVFHQVSSPLLPLAKGRDVLAALQINAQAQTHEGNPPGTTSCRNGPLKEMRSGDICSELS